MSQVSPLRAQAKQLVVPPPADLTPDAAKSYFEMQLACETDPADVHYDMSSGVADFVLLDVRRRQAFEACHIPGAENLPAGRIRRSTTQHLDRHQLLITYCWGPGCNGATKAAAQLSALGFQVRQMVGGLEYWRREGYDVEGDDTARAPLAG